MPNAFRLPAHLSQPAQPLTGSVITPSKMRVFFIFAPLRSGHHAFIDWILANNPGPAAHINNPPLSGPWFDVSYIAKKPDLRLRTNCSTIEAFAPLPDPTKEHLCAYLNSANNGLLLINFEGLANQERAARVMNSLHSDFPDSDSLSILFTRDPLNLLASLLMRSRFYSLKSDRVVFRGASIPSWREDAGLLRIRNLAFRFTLEFVQRPRCFSSYIDYASWLTDDTTRLSVSSQLGLPDAPVATTATIHGGGSSFTGSANVEPLQQLQRYRALIDTPVFRSLLLSFLPLAKKYYARLPARMDWGDEGLSTVLAHRAVRNIELPRP